MARSKRHTREVNTFSSRRLRLPKLPSVNIKSAFTSRVTNYLREFEDRRAFHPEGPTRPAASFSSPRHRLVVYQRPDKQIYLQGGFQAPFGVSKLMDRVPVGVQFRTPYKVLICVRRKQRREVLHALQKTGLGGGRQKSPVFTEYSGVRC